MRTPKIILSLCLSLWLLASPVLCSAATYTLTEQEMTRLEQIISESKQTLEISTLSLTDSQKQLMIVQKELTQARQELSEVKGILVKLSAELQQTRNDLKQANADLERLNQSYAAREKELNRQISSLKGEKLLWQILTVGVVGYGIFSKVQPK